MTTPYTSDRTDLVNEVLISAPVSEVWRHAVATSEPKDFMGGWILQSDLVVGHPISYVSADQQRVFVAGRLIQLTPESVFTHSAQAQGIGDSPVTMVNWHFEQFSGNRTKLVVTDSGYAPDDSRLDAFDKRWELWLYMLKTLLEDGRVAGGLKLKQKLSTLRAPRFRGVAPHQVSIPD